MGRRLVLVNCEEFWTEHFADYELFPVRLQASRWLLKDGKLWVFDSTTGKGVTADGVFWRLGPVRPFANHRAVLEMIRCAQIPCVNSAQVLLRGLDRLAMLNGLREIGLPVVPFTAVIGPHLLDQIEIRLPVVIKVGSYHAGYGKMLVTSFEQWQDVKDLVFITDDYLTLEPFIEYKRDIRCMGVGNQVWAMARNGSHWKTNSGIVDAELIPAPAPLYEFTRRAMEHWNADVLALDILETHDGQYVVLESNDVPGFAGFPYAVAEAIVERMHTKMTAALA